MSTLNLIKRGNLWQYRFEVSTVESKRKYVTKSGFKSRKEAKEAGIQALNDFYKLGIIYQSNKISVADYMDLWYKAYCLIQSRFNTQRVHGNSIEKHIKPILGQYALTDLSTFHVQEFVNALKLSGLGKQVVRNTYSTLNLALNYAANTLNLIKRNPCNGVYFPKFESLVQPKRYVITPTAFNKILEAYPVGTPEYLPLVLGYYTGMRISEVFALTWDDINFKNNTISINKIVGRRNYNQSSLKILTQAMKGNLVSGWFFGPTKSKASTRTIRITQSLAEILKAEKKRQEEAKNSLGDEFMMLYRKPEINEKGDIIYRLISASAAIPPFYPKADMICRRDSGAYFPLTSLCNASRYINKKLNIPFNFHSLRHSHATLLIQAGASILAIQKRLGHSKASITLNTYSHLTQIMEEKNLEILESQLRIIK